MLSSVHVHSAPSGHTQHSRRLSQDKLINVNLRLLSAVLYKIEDYTKKTKDKFAVQTKIS